MEDNNEQKLTIISKEVPIVPSHRPQQIQRNPTHEYKLWLKRILLPPQDWGGIGVQILYQISVPGIISASIKAAWNYRISINWVIWLIFLTLIIILIIQCEWIWRNVPELQGILLIRTILIILGIFLGVR